MQDIRRQLIIAIRWLPLIVIFALAAGGVTYAYASAQQEVYESTGTLRVDPGPDASLQNYAEAREALIQYARDAESRPVAARVIDDLGLALGTRDFREQVSIITDEDRLTMSISAQADDPEQARRIVKTMGDEMRTRVLSTLFTPQVEQAEAAIRQNSRLIDTYQKRLNNLVAKRPKDDDDRQEMTTLGLLISNLREANIVLEPSSRDFVRNRLLWSEQPRTQETPVAPRVMYWTLLALVAGAMLGAAVAFVLEYLRMGDRVRDTRDLEEATGLPSLGSVVEKRGDIRRGGVERLVMLRYPRSDAAEAYRELLTKIGFAALSARSMMVTSSNSSELASIVAANIALAYAEAGRTALLVDVDFRSPRLHTLFGVANDRGLTDLLSNRDVPLGFVTTPTPHPRLGLMPAGPPPSRIAQALDAPLLNALLRRLMHAADVVVFASPSLTANVDASVLAGSIEESVLVVEAGTPTQEVVDAAAVLERAKVHFTGAVLHGHVRGSHPRSAAVALTPPQVQWVPKAEPAPSEPRLTAFASSPAAAPAQGATSPAPAPSASPATASGEAGAPAKPATPRGAAGQAQPTPAARPLGPDLSGTVPSASGPSGQPGEKNGRSSGSAQGSRTGQPGARPRPSPSSLGPLPPPFPGRQQRAPAPGPDRSAADDLVAIKVGPYSAPFDPNPTKTTGSASRN